MTRQLKLDAYFTGSGAQGDSWRHPDADVDAGWNVRRYVSYARKLDAACFYDNVFAVADPARVESNTGSPRRDPIVLLAAFATATESIGLVGSVSTSYSEPYNAARAQPVFPVTTNVRQRSHLPRHLL